jgi:hypothetical protein
MTARISFIIAGLQLVCSLSAQTDPPAAIAPGLRVSDIRVEEHIYDEKPGYQQPVHAMTIPPLSSPFWDSPLVLSLEGKRREQSPDHLTRR